MWKARLKYRIPQFLSPKLGRGRMRESWPLAPGPPSLLFSALALSRMTGGLEHVHMDTSKFHSLSHSRLTITTPWVPFRPRNKYNSGMVCPQENVPGEKVMPGPGNRL